MHSLLVHERMLDENGITALEEEIDQEIQKATDRALLAAKPAISHNPLCVFSGSGSRVATLRNHTRLSPRNRNLKSCAAWSRRRRIGVPWQTKPWLS